MQALPKAIQQFLQNPIIIDSPMYLTYFYPDADMDSFNDFQSGYRYNDVINQSLLGTKQGDWQADWYVISHNYFSDPFIINIQEQDKGFPVYFAYASAGNWQLEKFCDSLDTLHTHLKALQELQQNPKQMLAWINQHINHKNDSELWQEIIETLQSEIEDDEQN